MSMEFTLNELQRQRVEDHLALVEQVLRRSIKTNETVDGMGHDDLYREGCIALCRAASPTGRKWEHFLLTPEPLSEIICWIAAVRSSLREKSAVVVAGRFCRDGSAGAGQPFSYRRSDL